MHMTTAELAPPDTEVPAAEDPQLETLRVISESITDLDALPQIEEFHALGDLFLDAVLGSRKEVLDAAVTELRPAEATYRRAARHRDDLDAPLARLETLLALATSASDRVPSPEDLALVAPGSRAHQVLKLLRDE